MVKVGEARRHDARRVAVRLISVGLQRVTGAHPLRRAGTGRVYLPAFVHHGFLHCDQ